MGGEGAVISGRGRGEHTSGITSGLVLAYVEGVGGRGAVERLLEGCGVRDQEPALRDPYTWISYDLTRELYRAAADVLDDPQVMRHVGEAAVDLSVGPGVQLAVDLLHRCRACWLTAGYAREG